MRSRLPLVLVLGLLGGCQACRRSEEARPSAAGSASVTVPVPVPVSAPLASIGPPKPAPDGHHCLSGPSAPKDDDDERAPVTSHDGLATVWTEQAEVDEDAAAHGETAPAWLCFERGGKRKVLLRTGKGDTPDAQGPEGELTDFASFVFSRDDRVVFFTTAAWAVSRAAHGVEVATGKEFFITDGNIIEELATGPFKGSLYASHYRLDEDHAIGAPGYTGRGVVTDIIDWHGKRLAKVPDEEGDPKERKRLLGR